MRLILSYVDQTKLSVQATNIRFVCYSPCFCVFCFPYTQINGLYCELLMLFIKQTSSMRYRLDMMFNKNGSVNKTHWNKNHTRDIETKIICILYNKWIKFLNCSGASTISIPGFRYRKIVGIPGILQTGIFGIYRDS
jgi:hypothetical protein